MAKTKAVMAADDLIAEVNKNFGEDTLTYASNNDLKVTRWPTGVLPIDKILDGGIPRGRFLEFHGNWSSMKSYVLYKALGKCQQMGGRVALIDTEHSFDPEWGVQLGLDLTNLLYTQPENAEQGIAVAESLVRQGYDMLGFDSIAAAMPKQLQENAPGEDNQPGSLARTMSKGLARLTAANEHTSIIFINQQRSKIGVTFGSPITTTGGMAMGFYSSYRLSFARMGKVYETRKAWDGEKLIPGEKLTTAIKVKVSIEKSKLSAPIGDCLFLYDLRTGEVDELGYLIGLAMEEGIITLSGSWVTSQLFGDKKLQGMDKLRAHLVENPEIVAIMKDKLLSGLYDNSITPKEQT